MWNRKIVLTSDKDFAKTICGENAYYFNPFDVGDISKKIITAYSDTKKTKRKLKKHSQVLKICQIGSKFIFL